MSKATELREQAVAKFTEAKEFVDAHPDMSAEDETHFNDIMKEAQGFDAAYLKEAGLEGTIMGIKERLDYYSGRVTGAPVDWSKTRTLEVPGRQFGGGSWTQDGMYVGDHFKSLGELFTEDESYKGLLKSGHLDSDNAKFESSRVGLKATTTIVSGTTDGTARDSGVTRLIRRSGDHLFDSRVPKPRHG